MNTFSLRCCWLTILISGSLSTLLWAQQPTEVVYRIKVITKAGNHFRGLLSDVTEDNLYLVGNNRASSGRIPFANIRKIVLRRSNKKNAMITGAIVGGLLTGYLANQSLQKNQVRTATTYGLTLVFSAAGGAAAGLLLGSALGNRKSIVIRPENFGNSELSLYRQLKPFSWHYQNDVINRLPKTNQ